MIEFIEPEGLHNRQFSPMRQGFRSRLRRDIAGPRSRTEVFEGLADAAKSVRQPTLSSLRPQDLVRGEAFQISVERPLDCFPPY